jgi:seryl-tRNA synthetase
MTTQPEPQAWSGAVTRELDGVQTRFNDFSNRLDKLLTLTEYHADRRVDDLKFANLSEKIDDNETDLQTIHRELRESFATLKHEVQTALTRETDERNRSIKEYIDAKKSQFRWLVSMVMIPLGIALVELLVPKK